MRSSVPSNVGLLTCPGLIVWHSVHIARVSESSIFRHAHAQLHRFFEPLLVPSLF